MKLPLALAICILSTPVSAQAVSDIASDQELFAGYCLGRVEQETIDHGREEWGLPDIDARLKQERDARRARFKDYLDARGYPSVRGLTARGGVAKANARGHKDERICDARIGNCVKKCFPNKDSRKSCEKECIDLESSCTALARCSQEGQLPF